MKTFSKTILLTLITVLGICATANTSMAARIGIIDMSLVYRDFTEVSKSQAYLKEKKDEYQGKIDKDKFSLKEEELALESLKEDFRNNRDNFSEDELKQNENKKRRLINSWQKKFTTMKSKFEGYKSELEEIEKKEFVTIKTRIDKAVQTVSKRNKLSLVIEKQFVYFGSTMDITKLVVKELQAQ